MRRKAMLATSLLLGLSTAQAQKVTLNFTAHWLSEQRRPTINKIIGLWNQRNPNVQVQYTGVPFDQLITKTLAGVAAGNAPDVVVIDIRTSTQRAARNQNTDMSQYGADKLGGSYFPQLWATGRYNGKQYALPFVTDTRVLFYNKAAFKEAGLDPNKPPRTWDDLWAYAAKLDKKDGDRWTRMGFHPNFGDFGYQGWVNNAGGYLFDKNNENPTMTSAAAVQTLAWFKKWNDKYGANNVAAFKASFGGGTQDEFMSGKVPMVVRNGNYLSTLARNAPDLQFGMVSVPTMDGKTSDTTTWGGGFNIEIPRGSKHPKEAFAFAKFLSTEGAKIWAAEQNDLPAYKAAQTANKNPQFIKLVSYLPLTYLSPAPLYAPSYDTAVNKAVDDVLLRGRDPQTALEEAQAAVTKMVDDNKKAAK
ncbi:multiple sugar transport system substrate-binding protein [Deinococcus metalli]|uniref:Multiple sugar transport system substrate-binding protein n=2 Tax=Deinococcus metalli TaxID=1141878 RepID=A0A7W8NSH2_9DEIO|nr:ABC transporter substrate-binding protein [Deinococcus metalli]MBB5377973.1 multiple sugar transport system substrate-binding protein [Deinococcus metalli]